MQFSLTAELFELDINVFQTVTDAFIKQEMTKAVKGFLLAALLRIPARTGFLKGSFTAVAHSFDVRNTGAGTPGYSTIDEYYYVSKRNRILKTPRAGIQFVTNPGDVLRKQGNQIIFELDNKISYFQANDIGNGVPSAPWNSLKEGYAVMVSYLEGSTNRFPKIDSLLTKLTIRASGHSITTDKQVPDVGAILATRELLIEGF